MDLEIEERDEFFMKHLSHEGSDVIFEIYHSLSRTKIMYVKQNKDDYVDMSKTLFDATHHNLLKLRRNQGLPAMPMYIHDYRSQREYKWKGRNVYNVKDKDVGHHVKIVPDHEHLSFDIVSHEGNRTLAWVSVTEKSMRGVCSYKISANPEFDIPFIVTLVMCVDDRYMSLERLKDSSQQAALCSIQ